MSSKSPQKTSGSNFLAVDDGEFLRRDELRGMRFALEYQKPELALRDWKIRSTIIVFGSARAPSPERFATLRKAARGKAAVARLDRLAVLAGYYESARAFARLASERGGALGPRKDGEHFNVIATGGGPGIMEAANRGAADAGAPSIGFTIALSHEEEPNRYTTPELTFQFQYFAMRKMHFAMRARALAIFPGGFGTFDELFEILTLQQTGKGRRAPVVLVGRDFWRKAVDLEWLVDSGVIDRKDLDLFDIVDAPDQAWESLVRRGVLDPGGFVWPRRPKEPPDAAL
ncbi:MAG TPA: TIGR00730 family Rossman fold protein [Vineibacter sp.]|nr:TIGR00730 family Rossman fold protein [Vineibacter sp.]